MWISRAINSWLSRVCPVLGNRRLRSIRSMPKVSGVMSNRFQPMRVNFWISSKSPTSIRSKGLSSRDLDRTKNRFAQPAFDGRNGHGDLRFSASFVFLDRTAALPPMRRADHATIGRTDRPRNQRSARGRTRHDPRSDRSRAQRRIQKRT